MGPAARFARRPGRVLSALTWAGVTAVVALVWLPFLRSPRVNDESGDWTFRTDYTAYALHAIFSDHQLPFWVTHPRFEQLRMPGVHDFFANPETDVLSGLTVLARLLPYLGAVKALLVLYLAVGVYGAQRLVRALSGHASAPATLLLSLIVLCNGSYLAHVLVGHVQFMSLALFPLSLALLVEAGAAKVSFAQRLLLGGGAGALLAVAFYGGNTHPLVHFVTLFVAGFSVVSALLGPRSSARTLFAGGVAGAAFVAFAAWKLVPAYADFEGYRADYVIRYDGWRELVRNLVTDYSHATGSEPHEQNAYIGWAAVGFLVLAVTGWNRRTVPLVLVLLPLPIVMFAHEGDHLLTLPLLRTQGAVCRLVLPILFGLAVAAAVRLNDVLARARRGESSRAFVVYPLLWLLALGLAGKVAKDLHANVLGSVAHACRQPVPVAKGPFDASPAFTAAHPRRATVIAQAPTANAFAYTYTQQGDPIRPELLVARELPRSGDRPHLTLVGDGTLTEYEGYLAVRPSRPQGRFELRFSDPRVQRGLVITVLATLGWIVLSVRAWRARKRRRDAGATTGRRSPSGSRADSSHRAV